MKRQPKRRIMQIDTSFRNANGLFLELNLEPQLMKSVAKNSPIIRNTGSGGNNRGSRYVVLNESTTLTSKSLLEQVRIKIEKQLSTLDDEEKRITVGTSLSNAEWVVAAPNCRSTGGGTKHRDTSAQVAGYLTVLLFFGDRKSNGYGTARVWRNSADFLPGYTFIPNDEGVFLNHMRKLNQLDGQFGGLQCNTREFNCAIFDSRLFHQSLSHSQPNGHRASLTFFLTLKERGLATPPLPDTTHYLKESEWELADLSNFI